MQIVHRLAVASTPDIQRELSAVGIDVASNGLIAFVVAEETSTWRELQDWIQRRQPLDLVTTTFTNEEIAEPSWLVMQSDWHHGYPEPSSNDFGYLTTTFDETSHCTHCGTGLNQAAPFRMRGEPRWGRRSLLQLHWVYGEFFVTPELWSRVFEPRGIECRPVLNPSGSRQLDTVLQLKIDSHVSVDLTGQEGIRCDSCGRTKFLHHVRGPFPRLVKSPEAAIAKTSEYFGSGAAAHHYVLVSQELARALASERGVSFWPIETSGMSASDPGTT